MTEYIIRIWKEKRYKIILPLIHFMLSFAYERSIFIFHLDKNVVTAIPMNNIVSDMAERVFGYIGMKICALFFIFALWQILFTAIDNIKKKYVWCLIGLTVILCLIYAAVYPYHFDKTWDAYVTYSYAIRFWPEYWHSGYSSIVYGGLLMVFPSPFAISFFQIIYLVASIGYLYHRISISPVLNGRGRHFVWLLLLIPDKDNIIFCPYRTDQYSILGIFLMSVILMDIVDRKKRTVPDTIFIIALAGLFSVWRTEGIILGAISVLAAIIFTYGKDKKAGAFLICAYFLATILLMLPQKLGDMKYYGKDYQFINSFATLYNILNDTSHNLSYDGAIEDIEAITKVVPYDLLLDLGIDGYREYNYSNGKADINQSMVAKEVASAYNKAYYNLILHNPKIFLRTQASSFAASAGFIQKRYVASRITGNEVNGVNWYFVGWDNGKADILNRKAVMWWNMSPVRQKMLTVYFDVYKRVIQLCWDTHFKGLASAFCFVAVFSIALVEFINIFRKKIHELPLGIVSVAILGQFMAILLVMPEDNIRYLQPSMCCAFVLLIVYLASKINKKRI